jgi:hypothetical protein
MNNVTLGLDKVRESQATTSDTLLVNQHDIRTDIADARSEQRLALTSLTRKVDRLSTTPETGGMMTPGDLTLMDVRLKFLESRLAESMQFSKMTPETFSTQPREKEAKLEQVLMRLIKPGILNYEENGRMISELIPVGDRKALKLDFESRINLIRHVQGLRLLLRLMRQDNYRSSVQSKFGLIAQSTLAWQAKVTSLWEFCSSFTELKSVLRNRKLNMSSAIPGTTCKYWLQYLFDRVDDREQDGEHIMELTLREWARFPVPDRAMPAAYLVPIPRRLLEPAMLPFSEGIEPSKSSQPPSPIAVDQCGDNIDMTNGANQTIKHDFDINEIYKQEAEQEDSDLARVLTAGSRMLNGKYVFRNVMCTAASSLVEAQSTWLPMKLGKKPPQLAEGRYGNVTCIKCFTYFSPIVDNDERLGICETCSKPQGTTSGKRRRKWR